MEFHNRLYQLRKQKGFSQEELANRLNTSRQTISKWENGESTPDLEKLVAISDLFEISLDELVLGRVAETGNQSMKASDTAETMKDRVFTSDNRRKIKKVLKAAVVIVGILVGIDIISMMIYFILYGVPK